MNSIKLVKELHDAFGISYLTNMGMPTDKVLQLRVDLFNEECDESIEAVEKNDPVALFDGLLDMQYILDGSYLSFGLQEYYGTNNIVPSGGFEDVAEGQIMISCLRTLKNELNDLRFAFGRSDISMVYKYLSKTKFGVESFISSVGYGKYFEEGFKEVHASNMSKLGDDGKPILDNNGKFLKGPNYFKPNLKKVLGIE